VTESQEGEQTSHTKSSEDNQQPMHTTQTMEGERINSDRWLSEYQRECPETPVLTFASAIFLDDDLIPSIASMSAQTETEERVSTHDSITDHETPLSPKEAGATYPSSDEVDAKSTTSSDDELDATLFSSVDSIIEFKSIHDDDLQTETSSVSPEPAVAAPPSSNEVDAKSTTSSTDEMNLIRSRSVDSVIEFKLAHDPHTVTPPLSPEQEVAASLSADEADVKPASLLRFDSRDKIESIPLMPRIEFIPQTETPRLSPEHDTKAVETSKSPPAATEYVDTAGKWDVLSERGAKGNHYSGNKRYRNLVCKIQPLYKGNIPKTTKTKLSKLIVECVNEYGGHFLKKEKQGRYLKMTTLKSMKKTSQALRERQFKWTTIDVDDEVEKHHYQLALSIVNQGKTA
jgi:hypothetical protein